MRRWFTLLVLVVASACTSPTSTLTPPDTSGGRTLFDGLTVGSGGGILRYTQAGDPLDGLTLTVPAGAYAASSTWTIAADTAVVVPLPAGFTKVGPVLVVSTDQGYANGQITIQVPMVVGAGNSVAPFYFDPVTKKLEGIPMVDQTATHVTLATKNFAGAMTATHGATQAALRSQSSPVVRCAPGFGGVCIVWVRVADVALQGTFGTSFQPGRDDWEFVNYGDYISPEGDCEGMSITAMYFNYYVEGTSGLYHKFDASLANLWDNVQGVRFAGSVQADYIARALDGINQIFDLNTQAIANGARESDLVKSLTSNWLMLTFKLTGRPVLIALKGNAADQGHAVVAYAGTQSGAHTEISFADPNHPGVVRSMVFDAGVLTPVSMELKASDPAQSFQRAYALGVSAEVPIASIDARYLQFKANTAGADRYPAEYAWMRYNYVTGHYEAMSNAVVTSDNRFYPAVQCPTCSPIAGNTPVDIETVIPYDASGATRVAQAGPNGSVILAPGTTTFVLAAEPNSTFSPTKSAGFLDSKTVTVTYDPGTYALTPGTALLSVVPGVPTPNVVAINRSGFIGPVTITASSDQGITITPSESPSPGNQTTLTVNVPLTVPVGTNHFVLVTGVAADLSPVTAGFNIVVAPAPTYSMSVQNSPLTIAAGGTSPPDNITITRTSFAGAISFSAVGEAGITATVTAQPGTGNTGTVTVSVPQGVAPRVDPYFVTITGSSSLANKTTTIAILVVPSAYTLSVLNAPLNLSPGTTSAIDVVTATRTNFSGAITVSGVADSGSGITVTFSSQPGGGTTGNFTVTVPAGTLPGQYTVTLTGASTLPNVQTSFAVVVANLPAAAFTFAVAPDPLNVVINHFPNYSYTVTLNRNAFAGDVTVSATTDDAGLVVTPNPAPATVGNNVALTVSVLAGVSVGTHTLTLHGASAGHADLVTPFSVVASLPVGGTPTGIVLTPTGTVHLGVGASQVFTAYLVDALGNRTAPASGWAIGMLTDVSGVAQPFNSFFNTTQVWLTATVQGLAVGTTPLRASYFNTTTGETTFSATTTITVP